MDMITGHGTGHRDGGVVFRAELRRAWVLSSFPQLYCTALYCIVLYCTALCTKCHFTSAEEDDPPVEEHHHAVPGQGDGQRVHGLADTVVPDLNNRWRC